MRNPFYVILCSLLLAAALAPRAADANLLMNGNFTGVTYTGSMTGVTTPYFGQVGPGPTPITGVTQAATGATLYLGSWSTGGYNFVYGPGQADLTTASAMKEAPGQFTSNGYGSTFLWGSGNGGATPLPTLNAPAGNFIAMDGAYEQGSINQSISNLTLGAIYGVTFTWAGAQQQGFTGITTDQFEVNLGTAILTTASTVYQTTGTPVTVASHSSSAWMTQTLYFTASATTQILSFLAVGTPNGEPPFALLGGVSLDMVPEPSSWTLFVGAGAICVFVTARRRRRAAGRVAQAGE